MNLSGDVISPNIFDAYVNPDIILPLVLANLLSSQLWDFSARISQRVALAEAEKTRMTAEPGQLHDLAPALRAVQHQINRHFEHLTHERVIETNGQLNLEDEYTRLGEKNVKAALDNITASFIWRESRGTAQGTDSIRHCIEQGKFPAYFYATFDVIRANRKGVRHRKHVPMGLTSCLDEVAIFAALVMTLPAETVDTVVILASPAHYTAFGWSVAGQPWWFYGKNALFSATAWHTRVAEQYQGDAQLAFEDCLPFADRVISINGTFNFLSGQSSIPEELLAQIVTMLDTFFGIRLTQLDQALRQPRTTGSPSVFAPLFRALLGVESIESVRDRLIQTAGQSKDSVEQSVLLSYRSLSVIDPLPFLLAARNSPSCRRLGKTLGSIQEALKVVETITDHLSIFEDRTRLAMPEETLRLDTGNDRDRAVLLHVLLEYMYEHLGQQVRVQTLFTENDSFVCGPDFCISLTKMASVEPPQEGVCIRLADFTSSLNATYSTDKSSLSRDQTHVSDPRSSRTL